MPAERFRAATARGLESAENTARVDREAGIIFGASAMQAVEALGHEVMVDAKTLAKVAELGNAARAGVKVRFTHPGMCSDGMGKMLGRMRDFRVQGDKVVGDIHLSESAARSPDGDLRSYVLDLAEEDAEAFGMSVVIEGARAWKLDNGAEVETRERPKNAVGKFPFLRPSKLHAVDVVDEPAANRDGLFSAAFAGTSNEAASEVFALFDQVRERFGMSLEKAQDFAARYFVARGVKSMETAGDVPAQNPKGDLMDKESLKALRQANPGHDLLILEMFADGKDEAEIVGAIKEAMTAAAIKETEALKAKLVETEAALAAEKANVAKLSGEVAEAGKKLAALTAVAVGAPKDPGQDGAAADKKDKPIECTPAELAEGKYTTADVRSGRVILKMPAVSLVTP